MSEALFPSTEHEVGARILTFKNNGANIGYRPRHPDRRLACFGRPGRWKELAPLMGKPINEEVVLEHWNDAWHSGGLPNTGLRS